MTAGVAVFGAFTATLASYFLEDEQRQDEKRDLATLTEIQQLRQELREVRSLVRGSQAGGIDS